jgi:uncharacterized protein YggE
MKSFINSFLIVVFFATTSFAQETFKGEPFIEVSGTAKIELDPNEIYLQVRLREFEENKNKTSLEKLDKDFLDALKAAGIDKNRLQLSNVGSEIGKLGKKEKDAFREKTYVIKLTSGAELEKLLNKLESVKVHQANITKITHSDIEKMKLDLKVSALQAARAKAEAMVKSIGRNIGKPLMIREWESPVYEPAVANVMVRYKANEMAADEMESETAFKKITLQTQVTAQFEIK